MGALLDWSVVMDLNERSLIALDWPIIAERLARHAATTLGQAAGLRLLPEGDPESAARIYEAVGEVRALLERAERLPLGGVIDVAEAVDRARRGVVLEPSELRDVGQSLYTMELLRRWIDERAALLPRLQALAGPIQVDPEVREALVASFDNTGELSAQRYPELAELRSTMRALQDRIRAALEEIIKGESLGDALQDRFVTERGGRFVIPVKTSFRRSGMGIVHATSASGETVFVEPAEVVERTNQLKEVEAQLLREIRRILSMLSVMVGRAAEPILDSLTACTELDLVSARALLGEELRGVIPRTGPEGAISLRQARHPVLVLRGVPVVSNDLTVDRRHPCLILTGPNTGGKTVGLKTLGLVALMARAGIPIPAADGARVDFFAPVLADVGDLQTVEGDLSTFSGHLLVLREMLQRGRPGSLVLLDEVGMGTDPAQGAALARAVIEALIDQGARVVVTTHFAELKGLAATDPRVSVAAAQYADGRPTWKLVPGLAGQSHALSVARRLELPEAIIERAREVLDAGTRELGDLMEQVDAERERLRIATEEQAEAARQLRYAQAQLAERERALEQRRRKLEETVLGDVQARMRSREDQVKGLIAALQIRPDLKLAGRTLQQIKDLRAEVEAELRPPAPPAPPPPTLALGDRVLVRSLGSQGKVVALLSSGQVEVEAGALRLKVKREDLSDPQGRAFAEPAPAPRPPAPAPERATGPASAAVRVGANTCDLRGQRVEEALERAADFLDRLVVRRMDVAFILHGHGTGALKQALRQWLPTAPGVKRWRPAAADEGGDAYTVVELA